MSTIKISELKLWWVYCYDNYYPSPELGDVRGMFYTEDEAIQYAAECRRECRYDYVEVEYIGKRIGIPDELVDN